jgi:hypothetical protein
MSEYVTRARLRELEPRLSPRDVAVVKRVSDLRFVSGAQLARLHFAEAADQAAGLRACRRALLRLVTLDLLARLPRTVGGVRAGSAGFVYHPGATGQRLAMERGWQPERRRRRSLIPGQLFLGHALQVAELHTLLVESDRSRRIELLELASEPACWRPYAGIGGQRETLKPDSYARLGLGPYEDSYFVEIDRGTEGSQTIERKLSQYVAYHQAGHEQHERGVFPTVLWLTPSEERSDHLRECVERLPGAARPLFEVSEFEDVRARVEGEGAGDGHLMGVEYK